IDDEDLAGELKPHLQSVGKYVRAQDLVDYLSIQENQTRLGFKKSISIKTAQQWMGRLGFQWQKEPTGQYSDGHECDDVVYYHQNVFLPSWNQYESRMQKWDQHNANTHIEDPQAASDWQVVVWFHDESTFYANDHWKQHWVHILEGAVPQPKGEGALLMVTDFVLADYGWLRSPNGKESACILF
ncbi:hypothetical protein BDR04DRAFT_1009393, partial [Suillus decipiens]